MQSLSCSRMKMLLRDWHWPHMYALKSIITNKGRRIQQSRRPEIENYNMKNNEHHSTLQGLKSLRPGLEVLFLWESCIELLLERVANYISPDTIENIPVPSDTGGQDLQMIWRTGLTFACGHWHIWRQLNQYELSRKDYGVGMVFFFTKTMLENSRREWAFTWHAI